MKCRKLGRTRLEVSEIGFGAWAIGGTSYGPTNDQVSKQALDYAFDQGVTFYDSADIYGHGHSERLIGESFQKPSKRHAVVIASKVGWDFYRTPVRKNLDPAYVRFACGESLRRLKTDYIDLYQLHNPKIEDLRDGAIFNVLDELKTEGKIRFWGVSIHLSQEGVWLIQNGRCDALQAVYHLLDQRVREELMPLVGEHEIGLVVREPLACGMLTGKYTAESKFHKQDHRNRWPVEKRKLDLKRIKRIQDILSSDQLPLKRAAIEFVLREPQVSVVIPGIKTIDHLKDHLLAAREPLLNKQRVGELKALLKEDLFQSDFYRN